MIQKFCLIKRNMYGAVNDERLFDSLDDVHNYLNVLMQELNHDDKEVWDILTSSGRYQSTAFTLELYCPLDDKDNTKTRVVFDSKEGPKFASLSKEQISFIQWLNEKLNTDIRYVELKYIDFETIK